MFFLYHHPAPFFALWLTLVPIIFPITNALDFDPYNVLQLKKSSSSDQIRKQYKKLAREW